MINQLPITLCTPGEIDTLVTRFIKKLQTITDDLFFEDIIKILGDKQKRLSSCLSQGAGSVYTDIVRDKDTIRDNAFINLRDYVDIHSRLPDAAVSKAASAISAVISRLGNTLYSYNDKDETIALRSLFNELANMESQVSLIPGLDIWLKRLKEAQADFEAVDSEKISTASKKEKRITKDARNHLAWLLNWTIGCLNLKEELYPGEYDEIISDLDKGVNEVLASVKSRNTRAENAKEDAPASS